MQEDLKTIQHWDYDVFEEWTKQTDSEIFEIDIDVCKLTRMMAILYRFIPKVGNGLSKLAELLNFKMVGVHEIPPELIKKYSPDNYEVFSNCFNLCRRKWNFLNKPLSCVYTVG